MSGVSHEHLAGIKGLKGEKKQTDFAEALELAGHVGDKVGFVYADVWSLFVGRHEVKTVLLES
jgi:hypothetical protein